MESNELLDSGFQEDKFTFSKKRTRAIIYSVLIIMVLNLILNYVAPIPTHEIANLDGTIASENEIRKAGFTTVLISVPILSFLLALILSFIPYKNLSYGKKYVRFALVTVLILNLIVLILSIMKLFT